MALIDDLLAELKGRLQITWDDQSTNDDLTKRLTRGQKYFNELCDAEFTFDSDSAERELLMERCRYDWNNALDEFEDNFLSDLSRLIQKAALDSYVPEVTTDDGTGTDTGNV